MIWPSARLATCRIPVWSSRRTNSSSPGASRINIGGRAFTAIRTAAPALSSATRAPPRPPARQACHAMNTATAAAANTSRKATPTEPTAVKPQKPTPSDPTTAPKVLTR